MPPEGDDARASAPTPESEGWSAIGPLEDLPDGRSARVQVDGNDVLVVRAGERIFAVGDRCSHQGAPLHRGVARADGPMPTVTCPAHGSVFSLEDGAVRARMGKLYAELEVQRYAALRVLSALNRGESPGPASSITKLSYTEFEKRFYDTALEILGPWGQRMVAREEFEEIDTSSGEAGTWATAFLWARAGTIYSGSSEVQKNIIGERVLGLPKEVRADRLRA